MAAKKRSKKGSVSESPALPVAPASEPEVIETIPRVEVSREAPGAFAHDSSVASALSKPSMPFLRRRRWVVSAGVAVLVILMIARIFHWWNWGLSEQDIQNREASHIRQQLGSIILLPGDAPTIALVTNAAALKASQAFYQNAQDGDVLVVYAASSEAILYRPSERKIINIALTTDTQSPSQAASSTNQ